MVGERLHTIQALTHGSSKTTVKQKRDSLDLYTPVCDTQCGTLPFINCAVTLLYDHMKTTTAVAATTTTMTATITTTRDNDKMGKRNMQFYPAHKAKTAKNV